MGTQEFKELLTHEPFEPFRIRLSSGDTYDVRNPDLVVVMKNRLFIAFPDGEHYAFCPFLHIAAVETVSL